jgi:site-specific recombinase XerD
MTGQVPAGIAAVQVAILEALMGLLQEQLLATKAANTIRAYATDLRDFQAYCGAHGLTALPAAPTTIAGYVIELYERGNRPSTILRRYASISMVHQLAGHHLPQGGESLIRPLFRTLRRHLYFSSAKAPLNIDDLRLLLRATPPRTAAGARDRALLLLGFAGGLGPNELVTLDVWDIDVSDRQLRIRVRRPSPVSWPSVRQLEIPRGEHPETCPVQALRAWYSLGGIRSGPVFRPIDRHGRVGATRLTDRAVSLVIKRAAQRAGLDPTRYAGHSLRTGLVVSAIAGGAPERVIMQQIGLRSLAALRRYPGRRSRFDSGAAAYLGL